MNATEAREIYERHGRGAYAVAISLLTRPAAAERAVEEAFGRLARTLESPGVRSSRGALLLHHAYHAANESAAQGPRPPRHSRAGLLASLPEEQRKALVLCLYGSCKCSELAVIERVSDHVIISRLHRALGHIRRLSTIETQPSKLRVLLANESPEHLERIAQVVTRLGHAVTARETDTEAVAALTEEAVFDLAIVGVSENAEHALDLIGRTVREANCPVIAILNAENPAFINQAAKRGVFAYLTTSTSQDDQLESAIDIVLARYSEFHDLQGAFGRRALTERAKGVLMERHAIDEHAAFLKLREQGHKSRRKLIDVAQAVLDARALLPDKAKPTAPVPEMARLLALERPGQTSTTSHPE